MCYYTKYCACSFFLEFYIEFYFYHRHDHSLNDIYFQDFNNYEISLNSLTALFGFPAYSARFVRGIYYSKLGAVKV